MAKFTRVQKLQLEHVLRNATRALHYVMQPDVAIARKGGVATTTLHYFRADGSVLYEVDKEIGSDLCGLQSAVDDLQRLLGHSL